ncbi:hypothetical protein B0H16DRAFT_1337352 [Mycena metata]|uniref:Mitochondrial splicing suppressor 51-like C-terminal domain-containing protein n=1 Tax=Mycena metata TaxID=1033252 RepID=A0AAD7HER9_9AGAR|nr:hypothetical protein B0H16DRAFT_1337352 [Mycena metata]
MICFEKVKYCQRALRRELYREEQRLVVYEPRCLLCGTLANDPSPTARTLIPCASCRLSFACEDHWNFVHVDHTQSPCEGGYDGLSQCILNQELLEDDQWHSKMRSTLAQSLPLYSPMTSSYRWIPPRTGNAWISVQKLTWTETFQLQLESEFPAARGAEFNVWMRRFSEILSMPMTVLYGLELLNTTLDWVKKHTLVIHVHFKALYNVICFETLLHRLPDVKRVKVLCTLLESELGKYNLHGGFPLVCCSDCESRGRTRYDEYYDVHYEDLPAKLGARYTVPDLAIAFNSGLADSFSKQDWKRTIAFLVSRNIPSLFTAYAQTDVVEVNTLLTEAGASSVLNLGPCRNPWGSMLGIRDVERPNGFYAENMWLAGVFNRR